jgi:hypothetical protein
MFAVGVFFITFGYACIYTGVANFRNGFTGPNLAQALGFTMTVAPPGASSPNLTGQPPAEKTGQSGTIPRAGQSA